MDTEGLAIELQAFRRRAGLTQAELARRMGTSQSLVARVEAAKVVPGLEFLDRWVRATGGRLRLTLGTVDAAEATPEARAEAVRDMFGAQHFDPWKRRPTAVEARTLERAGLPRPASRRRSAARRTSSGG